MSAQRLPNGGRIDRQQRIEFSWDDRSLRGYAGDSLASALLASNETVLGRSFKYHRPRGIMSAGVEESGAMVTIGRGAHRDPNVKATMQELYQGLHASGQNAWPNVRYDVGAVNSLYGRFLAAGFYYKTFMGLPPFEWFSKGTGLWMKYEKIIRKAAGMGTASREPDPDVYDHAHGFCDLLVVGSGPAGLQAALTVAKAGMEVWLVEQDSLLGGDLLNLADEKAEKKRLELIAELEQVGVRMMTRTTVFGLYDNGIAGLLERVTDHLAAAPGHLPRQRFWTLRARHTIVASGAMERGMAFGNNDRPGIMNVAAGRAYLNRYAVLAGQQIVVATNNDSAYHSAAELAVAGAKVSLLDARTRIGSDMLDIAGASNVSLHTGSVPLNARGLSAVNGLDVAAAAGDGWAFESRLNCDLLLQSGGWSPVVHLMSHRGVKPVWDAEQACFIAPPADEPLHVAGSAAGIWNTDACFDSGQSVGARVVKALGGKVRARAMPEVGGWASPIKPVYEVRVEGRKTKAIVDPQHDVTADDIRLAYREGFVSVEHLKRYTTLGMATDGGKVGNIIGLALMAEAIGTDIPNVGTTTFRPPYTPVAIGALKGRNVDEHFRPLRRTPIHDWNLQQGATMTMAGLWHRPWYFARSGETISEAYVRETETTRATVGLCDVTSLGKIAVQGPDATELLNRVYTNAFAKLPIGKARYGIMLRDDGMVMDDGTTWRFSETDYFMTTTTAHAAKVMVWLEELLQTRWQDLRVHVTSVSEQWAGSAVAGPKSREVLSACVEDPNVMSGDNFPFMGVIETTLKGGIPCRIARISFSGELAFEAYVPSDYAPAMMDLLWPEAQKHNGCLYGLEALGAMRIEKGHVTGAELDGRVSIDDAGLGKMANPDKPFIGKAMRDRPELLREDRPRLVGIKPVDTSQTFNAGSILCASNKVSGLGEGWITAVTHSPAMGHWIGLGFIAGGHGAWQGKTVVAADPVRKGNINVEIISPHMYDPKGEKMHA
ncbi:MAG: sarcosine oxidase subunit alpha family protein [Gammaproteobacteria bacterium]|nr:sarcosine oxidase subunit alpha family protein [Gammaproteobacteria bacterium]